MPENILVLKHNDQIIASHTLQQSLKGIEIIILSLFSFSLNENIDIFHNISKIVHKPIQL